MNWMGFKIRRTAGLLKRKGVYGECDWGAGTVTVDAGLIGRVELDTLIHEGLHAIDPDMSEQRVTNTARQLTALLFAQGYRKESPK